MFDPAEAGAAIHFDEHSCKTTSFAKTRVVFGGLVVAWVLSLTSRDTAGNAVWDMGLDAGAHPSGVLAGDTLFAPELGKTSGKVKEKVVEITRTLLVRRRRP